jgi:phosphodiesterase/alkaline phosphatase D-like protein
LDVSTTKNFATYVPGYQDLDVGDTTSYSVNGLSADTHYYYRLRASNGICTSHDSKVIDAKTAPCTPKAPDAKPATDVTASSFTAKWSNVPDAIDYRLDVSANNNFNSYVPGYQDLSVGNVTGFPVTGLNANTTYYYRVRADNGCATSPNSNVKNIKTKPH